MLVERARFSARGPADRRPPVRPALSVRIPRYGARASHTPVSPVTRTYWSATNGSHSEIVGEARSYSAPRRLVPPVLHVALDKLAARGAQQMTARDLGLGIEKRHGILELIPKSVGAARLIERRPRPHATGQRLIQRPSIEQDVEFGLRRPDADDRQTLVPSTGRVVNRRGGDGGIPVSIDQRRAASSLSATPRRTTTSRISPGRSAIEPRSAAHGSYPAPVALESSGSTQSRGRREVAIPSDEVIAPRRVSW